MPAPPPGEAARLTEDLRADDEASQTRAFSCVYDELRELARAHIGRERAGHTLVPTELVNEACLRLIGQVPLDDLTHRRLLGYATRAMRQVLIDHARRRGAAKRGKGWDRVTLRGIEGESDRQAPLLALARALEILEERDGHLAEVIHLHYFAGLTVGDLASRFEVSPRTMTRQLSFGRAMLLSEIDRIDPELS